MPQMSQVLRERAIGMQQDCPTELLPVNWMWWFLYYKPSPKVLQQSICITKHFLHKLSETVSGKLICMLVILIGVSTWLQFVVTDLSGQMLTFDGVWHFGEVFSSRMNLGFHCTGQMADSVYGIVWVSGLQIANVVDQVAHGGAGVMVWEGVCYGQWTQVHFIDGILNAQSYRDNPLLCHSSTTITSCCSMIMHGPMLQGSVHNFSLMHIDHN